MSYTASDMIKLALNERDKDYISTGVFEVVEIDKLSAVGLATLSRLGLITAPLEKFSMHRKKLLLLDKVRGLV